MYSYQIIDHGVDYVVAEPVRNNLPVFFVVKWVEFDDFLIFGDNLGWNLIFCRHQLFGVASNRDRVSDLHVDPAEVQFEYLVGFNDPN